MRQKIAKRLRKKCLSYEIRIVEEGQILSKKEAKLENTDKGYKIIFDTLMFDEQPTTYHCIGKDMLEAYRLVMECIECSASDYLKRKKE